MPNFAGAYQVIEPGEGFLNRRVRVAGVKLQQIDVVAPEPPE